MSGKDRALPLEADGVERNGHHLFTRLVALRALEAGARLAIRLEDGGAAGYYAGMAEKLSSRLPNFWTEDGGRPGYWRATIFGNEAEGEELGELPVKMEWQRDRTSLDCALPLSVIHVGDRYDEHSRTSTSFSPIDPGVLSTLREYIVSFQGIYKINHGHRWTSGWALGRYAEDMYDGVGTSEANPW